MCIKCEAVAASQVACGARHTLALTQRGAAFAAGWNRFGQLGVGAGERASRRTATRVAGPWSLRCARHAAAHARAPSASACGSRGAAQHGTSAGVAGDAGPAGWASGGGPDGSSLPGVGAAGCGADTERLPDAQCSDSQGQAGVGCEAVGQGTRCAEAAHAQLGAGAGGKLQDAQVLDVAAGWWHSLFVVELV